MCDHFDQNSQNDFDHRSADLSSMNGSDEVFEESEVGQDQPPPLKKQRLSRYWHFRFTAYKVDQKDLQTLLDEIAEAYGFQKEKGGKNGTEHYQGTFDVGASRARWGQLEKGFQKIAKEPLVFPKCDYLEKSDSKAADRYGMKEGTRIDGPWWKGAKFDEIAKETVYRIDIELRPWQKRIIKRVLAKDADDRKIWWLWEPNGGLGKTTFQKWIFQEYAGVIVLGGKAADMKMGVIQYIEANNGKYPEIVIINIPKTFDLQYFSASGIEEVKDMFFFSGKYKGGHAFGRPPKMLIFANQEVPDNGEMARDRWMDIRLPDGPGGDKEIHAFRS
jgi:hypothetical protein